MGRFSKTLEKKNKRKTSKARANKKSTVELWQKIKTFEDKEWTQKYNDPDPNKKCFGGRVIIKMQDGTKIEDEISVADAHPSGNRPFERSNYIEKFQTLTEAIITPKESERFINDVQNLRKLKSGELTKLNVEVKGKLLRTRSKKAIF